MLVDVGGVLQGFLKMPRIAEAVIQPLLKE
jgi:hypothetical protein